MNVEHVGIGVLLILTATGAAGAAGAAASDQPQTAPPTTASAEVMQCAQAQMVVDQLLATAMMRLEVARQTNAAADLRAAVGSVQTTLRDARAQFVPCASIQPAADAHGGHSMSGQTPMTGQTAVPMDHSKMNMGKPPAPSAGTKPVSPPMDHSKMNMGTPATPASGAKPGTGMKPPASPPPMDHSKMDMGGTAKPAAAAKPAATKPPSGSKPAAAPSAMDHSKMDMGATAKPAPATKPAAGTKPGTAPPPMDHSKMDMDKAAETANQPTDPVCGLKVDPATAPQAAHGGNTYHFCGQPHRDLFQKNPAKYLPKGK